jgi:L-lysine 2,3-aminomutase
MGKQVCLHTHINHAREITWVTRNAANYLFEHGVIVRNQSVLLNGVNNTYEALSELIKTLSDINIQPVSIPRSTHFAHPSHILEPLLTSPSTTSTNATWSKESKTSAPPSPKSSSST